MNKSKILFIEDDPDFADATARILEAGGYEVVQAATGKKGLEKANQENPALIILDVMLPDQEGFSICRELKDDPKTSEIPVLILTAVSAKEKGEGYAEKISAYHKADGYLEKPVKPKELLETAKRLITSATKGPQSKRTTVLLAEDDQDFATATKLILETNGYRVLVAESGEQCITMAKTHLPNMIILDVMLPGKDGYTTCYELKDSDRTRAIPILMLTAVGEQFKRPEFAQEIAIDHQADDYADKPIKPEHLLRKVRKYTLY